MSTTKAEYIALSRAAQQATWMFSFMSKAGLAQELLAILNGDNMSSIAMTVNNKGHSRVKHIDVRHHYICKHVQEGDIKIKHVPSSKNLADILTKPLPRIVHQCLVHGLLLDA